MNKNKTYTEGAFDKLFSTKKLMKYEFNTKNMGVRDKKVVAILTEYKINAKTCLDIGPGTGRWLQFLKENGAKKISASDISQESLDRCDSFCDYTQKVDLECEQINIKNKTQDIILCFMVLEHLRDPENLISEISRMIKNEGLIIMSIPNIASFLSRARLLFGFLPRAISSDKTHVKFYTKRELRELFKPFDLCPIIIPTSFSIHPFNSKKWRISSTSATKSMDDHILFKIVVNKKKSIR
jgi:2-polyprenyl-3-methyl-5-hydroxy-6-metoxy-1,4-benzoquinol methylase